jgi:hypothetical protein
MMESMKRPAKLEVSKEFYRRISHQGRSRALVAWVVFYSLGDLPRRPISSSPRLYELDITMKLLNPRFAIHAQGAQASYDQAAEALETPASNEIGQPDGVGTAVYTFGWRAWVKYRLARKYADSCSALRIYPA